MTSKNKTLQWISVNKNTDRPKSAAAVPTAMGLDSFVLAPFLPELESDHPHAFPPLDSAVLDPHSEKLVTALDLDSSTYSHVDPIIMQQFKGLLRKYLEAFYLPGTKFGTVKDFYHNIDTGQSPLCTVFHIVRVQQSFVQSKVGCKRYSRSVLFSQVIPFGERHVF